MKGVDTYRVRGVDTVLEGADRHTDRLTDQARLQEAFYVFFQVGSLHEYFKFNHSKFLQNEDLLFESFKS